MPCGHWTKKVWTKTKTGPKSSQGYEVKLKQTLLSKPTLMTIAVSQLPSSNSLKKLQSNIRSYQRSAQIGPSAPYLCRPPPFHTPTLDPIFLSLWLGGDFPMPLANPSPLQVSTFLLWLFPSFAFLSEGHLQTPVHTYAPKWPWVIAIALVPAVVEVYSWTCTRKMKEGSKASGHK